MANAIQERLGELGWKHHQYDVMNEREYKEVMEKFHRVRNDSTIEREEVDVADKSLDEIKRVFLELNLDYAGRFSILWPFEKFGIKAELKSFAADLDSLWYPAQDDVVFVRENGTVLIVLDHEEKIEIWSMV